MTIKELKELLSEYEDDATVMGFENTNYYRSEYTILPKITKEENINKANVNIVHLNLKYNERLDLPEDNQIEDYYH